MTMKLRKDGVYLLTEDANGNLKLWGEAHSSVTNVKTEARQVIPTNADPAVHGDHLQALAIRVEWSQLFAQRFVVVQDRSELEIIERPAPTRITVGSRIESGDGDDYDTGVVHELNQTVARVGWDSGGESWEPLDLLRVLPE